MQLGAFNLALRVRGRQRPKEPEKEGGEGGKKGAECQMTWRLSEGTRVFPTRAEVGGTLSWGLTRQNPNLFLSPLLTNEQRKASPEPRCAEELREAAEIQEAVATGLLGHTWGAPSP